MTSVSFLRLGFIRANSLKTVYFVPTNNVKHSGDQKQVLYLFRKEMLQNIHNLRLQSRDFDTTLR